MKGSPKILLTKSDLAQAFVYNKEYMQEMPETKKGLHSKKYEGDGVSYFYKEAAVNKEISRLTYEQHYVSCLLTRCGCNLKTEKCTDELKMPEVSTYIRQQDASNISSLYYEFKHYGIKRLGFIIKTRKKIDDALFCDQFVDFRKYCVDQSLKTIYDLLLFPYYSRSVVDEFGVETIQKVIQVIIDTIEIILIDVGETNFDLTDLI